MSFPQNDPNRPVPVEEFQVPVQVPPPGNPVPATLHHANPARQFEHQPVKQSRDRAQYVREQKGHSWLLHWVLLGWLTMFIVPLYYTFSPNHYWHL